MKPPREWDLELDRRQFRTLLLIGIVVGAIAAPVIASHLTNPSPVSGGVTVANNNGLNVTVTGTTEMDLTNFTDGSDTITVVTEAGNATVSSPGAANVTLHKDEITGSWTNITSIDATTNEVTVDPSDKPAVTMGKEVTSVNVSDTVKADDDTTDFVYNGTDGLTSKVVVRGLQPGVIYHATDANSDALLDVATADSNGKLAFDSLSNSEHTVEVESAQAGPSLSNPSPEGPQNTYPTTVSVDVTDDDFPAEEVDVTFYLDNSQVGTDTLTSEGTASTTISAPTPGEHTVRAEAEDAAGNQNNLTWTFSTPDNLTIRRAQDPWSIIDDRQVNVTFYQDDVIVDRNTSTGNVSLEGLNVDEQFVVEAETRGYRDSYLVISDITVQNTIYMLNASADRSNVTFVLRDETGGTFENNNASLEIQRPVNVTGTKTWVSIHSDEFGVDGVTLDLETGQRYRLIISNDQGDKRMLGSYTPQGDETRQLTVSAVDGELVTPDSDFRVNASYLNTSSQNYVKFGFNDTTSSTDKLTVNIHERGNTSNILLANTTFGGPLGTVSLTEPIPADQEDTEWVVNAYITQDNEVTTLTIPVGPKRPILPGMSPWLTTLIAVASIWIVAGLFSQLNGDVGGIVVAGMGAMFWFVDFLPQGTGIGVVVLSLITAAAIFINERRGGGLQ